MLERVLTSSWCLIEINQWYIYDKNIPTHFGILMGRKEIKRLGGKHEAKLYQCVNAEAIEESQAFELV